MIDQWNVLSKHQKEACTKAARGLLLGAQRFSGRVKLWSCSVDKENKCLKHNAFEKQHERLVSNIDKEIKRQLKRLVNEGFKKPLIPLCHSIWREGMDIGGDAFETVKDEWAVTLIMLRALDTACLVQRKIDCCGTAKDDQELSNRGL